MLAGEEFRKLVTGPGSPFLGCGIFPLSLSFPNHKDYKSAEGRGKSLERKLNHGAVGILPVP